MCWTAPSIPSPPRRSARSTASARALQQRLALIEEMEEAVRLLADERKPEWETTDLRAAAEEAMADKRAAAEARGGNCGPARECKSPSGRGLRVQGDGLRLAPLLRHLLIHCIWRAPAGGSVRVHLVAEADYVKFRISESPRWTARAGRAGWRC